MAPITQILKSIPPMIFSRSLPIIPSIGGAPPANQHEESEPPAPNPDTDQIIVPIILGLGILIIVAAVLASYFAATRPVKPKAPGTAPVLTHHQWIADRHLRPRSLQSASRYPEPVGPYRGIDPCYKLNRQNEGYFGGTGESGHELQRYGDWTGSYMSGGKKLVNMDLKKENIKLPEGFSLK